MENYAGVSSNFPLFFSASPPQAQISNNNVSLQLYKILEKENSVFICWARLFNSITYSTTVVKYEYKPMSSILQSQSFAQLTVSDFTTLFLT